MAIAWVRETAKDRGLSGTNNEGNKYTRSFLVRTSSPDESLDDIVNACGIAFGDPYFNWAGSVMQSFDCKPADESGLLYSVTFTYSKLSPTENPKQEQPEAGPGALPGKLPVWSASSSITSGPVFKDVNGDMIVNSAGDPLEGLEMERAEFRLTLTQYFLHHSQWEENARDYTNCTNDAIWMGALAGWWKCQGASAKLNTEGQAESMFVYWEVTWEFAYRDGGWDLKPWDVGFAQLVDDTGTATMAGTKRAQIKGQDGKPVRQPVGLCNGIAVVPPNPPCELSFQVYTRRDFMTPFGELYTPG